MMKNNIPAHSHNVHANNWRGGHTHFGSEIFNPIERAKIRIVNIDMLLMLAETSENALDVRELISEKELIELFLEALE